jgi:hypothetical protein
MEVTCGVHGILIHCIPTNTITQITDPLFDYIFESTPTLIFKCKRPFGIDRLSKLLEHMRVDIVLPKPSLQHSCLKFHLRKVKIRNRYEVIPSLVEHAVGCHLVCIHFVCWSLVRVCSSITDHVFCLSSTTGFERFDNIQTVKIKTQEGYATHQRINSVMTLQKVVVKGGILIGMDGMDIIYIYKGKILKGKDKLSLLDMLRIDYVKLY